jgi:CRISPR-associated protein Cmr6
MPIRMPNDTAKVLGPIAAKCTSRSLFLDRFADPTAKDSGTDHPRRDWFRALLARDAEAAAGAKRTDWLAASNFTKQGTLLHAQVQSRLLINVAGGVMENAGLCLDRFGLPYIPGSAVKGCARRAATQALLDETSTDAKARLLYELCLVFGWGDTDWKTGRKRQPEGGAEIQKEPHSDYWWSMAPDTGDRTKDDQTRHEMWQQVATEVARRLVDHLGISQRNYPEEPWRDLPSFAGSVAFLPAYPTHLGRTGAIDGLPLSVPPLGKLELDVVTCHHREYYEGRLETATDTEEPVPVVFPAVAPGHVFTFAMAPLRGSDSLLLSCARSWLETGLETFGIGAKTNAGYGWFSASAQTHDTLLHVLLAAESSRQNEARRQAEEAHRKAEEQERQRKLEELKAATAGMSAEQKADFQIAHLNEDQFRGWLEQFPKKEKAEQEAIVRALRLPADAGGSRRSFWDRLKAKAEKGGKPAQIEQIVRQVSKLMYPGKEGKMP